MLYLVFCKSREEMPRHFASTEEGSPPVGRAAQTSPLPASHVIENCTRQHDQTHQPSSSESVLPASAEMHMRAAAMKYNPRPFLFGSPLGMQPTSILFIEHTSPDGQTGRISRITSKSAVQLYCTENYCQTPTAIN